VTRWVAGEVVTLQEVWRRKLWSARPMVVVESDDEFLALWKPLGTRWRTATDRAGVPRLPTRGERFAARMTSLEWVLAEFSWDVNSLWIIPRSANHAVNFGWDAAGNFLGWYVNLQEKVTLGRRTVQTMDLMLDLVISPNGRWSWKDEDEIDLLVQRNLFDTTRVAALRREALDVVRAFEGRSWPFDARWDGWRPEAAWTTPQLPPDWDVIEQQAERT
jgi:predicted RNA-binding protein associated with RNAse of E/G family